MDLADVCNYSKALIIRHMPDDFTIAEKFRHGLTDDEIRKGIAAFRAFLYALYDKLAAEKDTIDSKTRGKFNPYIRRDKHAAKACFPTLSGITYILFALGIRGQLEMTPEMKLTVKGRDMLAPVCALTEKYPQKYNRMLMMSGEQKAAAFRILADLGLCFNGVDFSGEMDFAKIEAFEVACDENAFCVAGLKLLAEAAANHRDYIKMENVFCVMMQCDFYPLAHAQPKKQRIVDIGAAANGQPPEIRDWVIKMDKFLTDNGCKREGTWEITYYKPKTKGKKGMVFRISMDITGCYVLPGINHLYNPNSIIDLLPDGIVDLMTATAERECGWCAYSRREPGIIQCRPGCPYTFTHKGKTYTKCRNAEFQIPVDNAENRNLIRKWIEMELAV